MKVHIQILDKSFGQAQQARFLLRTLNVEKLLLLDQVHSDGVVDADLIDDFAKAYIGDAAVTSKKQIALAIQTADCVPVLLSCREKGVIGAAHCGWRSAKLGILDKLVALMRKKGAIEIDAVIGPCIHQMSYEVDKPFIEAFLQTHVESKRLFIDAPKKDHYYFDLPGFVVMQLDNLKVTYNLDRCEDTYSHPEKYFSYRRHQKEGGLRGNIFSTIILK